MSNASQRRPPHDEFDEYAAGYDAGMDNWLKKRLGASANAFIEPKVRWLLRAMRRQLGCVAPAAQVRLLDYGCGVGTLLSVLRQHGFAGAMAGCDVSLQMLGEARRRWNQGPVPDLGHMEPLRAPFQDGGFDVVVLSSVLHHVSVASRPAVYADVMRLLKPRGRAYVFEHNPFNPVTRWVVRRTPIDRGAVLLKPGEIRAGLRDAGSLDPRTRYILFFPPRMEYCRPIERLLPWLPCGAQYVVFADRP
jgi:SAM-dependent methyltransferase